MQNVYFDYLFQFPPVTTSHLIDHHANLFAAFVELCARQSCSLVGALHLFGFLFQFFFWCVLVSL
jgi:hypothetical protein